MIIHTMPQHFEPPEYEVNPEWLAVKSGIPSASVAAKIITGTGAPSTQGWDHINRLISEIADCDDEDNYTNDWMKRGIEMEAEARALFCATFDLDVEQIGFATNADGTVGLSPDGIICQPGTVSDFANWKLGWECKCPKGKTQVGYLRKAHEFRTLHAKSNNVYTVEALPAAYKQQVHFSLAVTGLPGWWFMTYHPKLDPMFILVKPDAYTVKMRIAINAFVQQLADEKYKLGIE